MLSKHFPVSQTKVLFNYGGLGAKGIDLPGGMRVVYFTVTGNHETDLLVTRLCNLSKDITCTDKDLACFTLEIPVSVTKMVLSELSNFVNG